MPPTQLHQTILNGPQAKTIPGTVALLSAGNNLYASAIVAAVLKATRVKGLPFALLKIGLGVGGSVATTSLLLSTIGFSSIGPVAGSLAAAFQSAFGTPAVFSFLQGAAMGGAAATPLFMGAGLLGGIGAALYITQDRWKPAVMQVAKDVGDACKNFWDNACKFFSG